MQPTFVCYPFILITAEELSGFQSIPSTGNNKWFFVYLTYAQFVLLEPD